MIYLIPIYKRQLKKQKSTVILSTMCSDEKGLQEMFQNTNWELFFEEERQNVSMLGEVIFSYIAFCYDMHLERKRRKIFLNNKIWFSSELRKLDINFMHDIKLKTRLKLRKHSDALLHKPNIVHRQNYTIL